MKRNRKHDRGDRCADDGNRCDGDHDAGNCHDSVHQAHDHHVEPAKVARQQSKDRADQTAHEGHRGTNGKRCRGPVDDRANRYRAPADRYRTNAARTVGAGAGWSSWPVDRWHPAGAQRRSVQQTRARMAIPRTRLPLVSYTSQQWRECGGAGDAYSAGRCSIADPRIEQGVDDVDGQINEDIGKREQNDHALNDRESRAPGPIRSLAGRAPAD